MKIKPDELQKELQKLKMKPQDLADDLEVDVKEIEKLLNGEAVEYRTACLFVDYWGANLASQMIDWQTMGIENPLVPKL